jgi:hypothetical protein
MFIEQTLCVTTTVCNTLFCVPMKLFCNTLIDVLQECVTIAMFCSSARSQTVSTLTKFI